MNNRMIVIYKSSTGFTKRYAEFIAQELNCTMVDFRTVTPEFLSEYDSIIFGSRAHAGKIDGLPKMKKIFQKCTAKNLLIFVTGATANTSETVIQEFFKQNFTAEELRKIPHFYMQSGLCYEKMSFFDKCMMKGLAAMLKKKKDKTSYEIEMEHSIQKSYDISSKKYIEPLIHYLQEKM